MNLRHFVLSLAVIVCSSLALFLLLGVFELPLLWLAAHGYPSDNFGDLVLGGVGGATKTSPIGLFFVAVVLLASALLALLAYRTFSKTIESFAFLTTYYAKLYRLFSAALLAIAWLLPAIWAFKPFNLVAVAAIAAGLIALSFAAITILLRDVLALAESGTPRRGDVVQGGTRP
jgi:hypothetical protein